MTTLAHNCAVLGIPVDPYRLWKGDDPYFERWLSVLVDRVSATRRAAEGTT